MGGGGVEGEEAAARIIVQTVEETKAFRPDQKLYVSAENQTDGQVDEVMEFLHLCAADKTFILVLKRVSKTGK